jgi:hypothetical protein
VTGPLEDRIQQLCAQIAATDNDEEIYSLCSELREALSRQSLISAIKSRTTRPLPKGILPGREIRRVLLDDEAKQRVKELCDLIAKEQDHRHFSVLLEELNNVLDGVQPINHKDGNHNTSPSLAKSS